MRLLKAEYDRSWEQHSMKLNIGQLYLEESFLAVERVHDDQVNGATKIDKVGLCTVYSPQYRVFLPQVRGTCI